MGYASRSGRARTSARNPRAFGVCDRCGQWYNHDTLSWQFDWRGASLMNTRVLVCNTCLDVPQTQLRAIVVPADPVPIMNPRTENLVADETNYRTTSGQDTVDQWTGIPVPGTNIRITQNNNSRVTQQTGEAPGGLNQLPGTDWNVPVGPNGVGVPYGNTSIPFTGPLSPPYNNIAIWNNIILWNVNWVNNSSNILPWSTTTI